MKVQNQQATIRNIAIRGAEFTESEGCMLTVRIAEGGQAK